MHAEPNNGDASSGLVPCQNFLPFIRPRTHSCAVLGCSGRHWLASVLCAAHQPRHRSQHKDTRAHLLVHYIKTSGFGPPPPANLSLTADACDYTRKLSMSSFQDAPFSTPRPILCTEQHSQLQQEQLYLQQALAEDRRRKERLTRKLEKNNAELEAAAANGTPDLVKVLKKSIKGTRSNLNRCVRSEQSLTGSIANVVAQMQRLEQHQWHRAPATRECTHWSDCQPMIVSNVAPSLCTMPSYWSHASTSGTFQVFPPPAMFIGAFQPYQTSFQPVERTAYYGYPLTPILRPLQPSSSQTAGLGSSKPPPGVCLQFGDELDYMISPTDTVSTYNLSPGPPMPSQTFPTSFSHTNQKANAIDGMKDLQDLAIQEPPEQSQTRLVRAHADRTEPSSQKSANFVHRLALLDGHRAALRLQKKAQKRDYC